MTPIAATGAAPTSALEPLDAVAPDWERLADSVQASPFLHPGFVQTWWRAFGRGRLRVASLRGADGRLAAVLPLVQRGAALISPANWHTPQTALLAEDEQARAAFVRALFAGRPRRLGLCFLDAPDADALSAGAEAAGYRVVRRTLLRSPYVDTTGDWEDYEAGLSRHRRADLRRCRRRLTEQGTLTLEETDGRAGVDGPLDELMRIEALGWKGGQGTAMAQEDATRRFYRELAHWAAGRGWLRFHALRLDDRVLALAVGLSAHGVHYGLKMGYDPDVRRLSPGRVLIDESLRAAFAGGLRRYELLGDDDPYKREWARESGERIALDAFAPTTAGRLAGLAVSYGRPAVARARRRLGR